MIRPTKFLDPKTGVLRVAATMIETLDSVGPMKLEEFMSRSAKQIPPKASVNIQNALDWSF